METLDKLYLELSQITSAKSEKELSLENQITILKNEITTLKNEMNFLIENPKEKISCALDDIKTIMHTQTHSASMDRINSLLYKFLTSNEIIPFIEEWIINNSKKRNNYER